MNILLVYPKPNLKFYTTHSFPLGMGYIAAVLEQENHNIFILDLNIHSDNLEEVLDKNKIDITGIYAKTVHIKSVWKLCERIKKHNPKIRTVLGGPHPSVLPEESLNFSTVDIVIRKEDEYSFKELCINLSQNKVLKDIKGISYKSNGKIIHNPDREFINNLDDLPFPARHLFNFEDYTKFNTRPTWNTQKNTRIGTIITSRGCPYQCVFCFHGVHGYNYRYRSPENVIKEIKLLKEKYNVNFIEILDDNFALIEERAKKICELMIKENLNIKWTVPEGFIRADKVSQDLLRLAKQAGCVDFWFAMESGSQRVLDNIINKKTSIEQIKETAQIAKKEGFETGAFICIGNFGETEEEILASINLARSLDIDKCQFTIVTPYPGSKLYDELHTKNKLLITDWDKYSPYENKAFFEYPEMTKEKIEYMYQLAFKKFYFRPSYVLKTLKRKSTYTNFSLILKELYHFLFSKNG